MDLVRSGARGEDSIFMTAAEFARDWSELLDRLDRHAASGLLSPDTATLPDLMDTYRVPGISIAVGGDDGQVWAEGYGTTGAAEPTPVNLHTAFQACSISKHVAAFGALRLVADGVLDLDTDIHAYLTSWRLPASEGWRAGVTLRQLLAHTAGLSSNWFRGYGIDEAIPSLVQTLQGIAPANTPPVRSSLLPGSRFRYSGSHYAVLQQLMVDVTGSRFDELMHALVLEPVAMADSSFNQQFPHQRPQQVALGHHVAGTPVPGGWRTIPEMAGAGLWSTPTDLLRLELEIARAASGKSQLLDQSLVTQMLTPQLPDGTYGLGTEIHDSIDHWRFGHTGLNVGYNCFSFAWPDASAAVSVMTNSDDAREVLASILAAADRQYATDIEATPPADVTGRYLLQDNYPIDIAAADGRLTLTVPGHPSAILLPLQNGHYRHPGLDLEIWFHRTADQPYTMELRQEGITQTATRSVSPATELP
jgi:CubicO group peptidase (beta-lactamase class C family)